MWRESDSRACCGTDLAEKKSKNELTFAGWRANVSSVFGRQSRRRKRENHMKKTKSTTNDNTAKAADETARETSPETTAIPPAQSTAPAETPNELPTEIAAMPRDERDRLLAALMAQKKAEKLSAKKPPKQRMRKEKRCCLWLDHELHAAFTAWSEENAKDKTMELAGNLLIAEAIGWAIPEGFIAAPKPKMADKEKTAES